MRANPASGTALSRLLLERSIPEPNSGCVIWLGQTRDGYGRLKIGGRFFPVHRLAFELAHGPIPLGLFPDHVCRVRSCINAGHLELVTFRENILRGDGITARCARKTHCLRGHSLGAENCYPTDPSRRVCRQCARKRAAERHNRGKSAAAVEART